MTIDEEAFSKAVMAAAPLGFVSTTQMRKAIEAYEQAKKPDTALVQKLVDALKSNQYHASILRDVMSGGYSSQEQILMLENVFTSIDDSDEALTEAQAYLKQQGNPSLAEGYYLPKGHHDHPFTAGQQEGKASEVVENALEIYEFAYEKYGEHVVALRNSPQGGGVQLFNTVKLFAKNNSLAEYERVKDEAATFAKKFVAQFNAPTQQPAQQGKRAEGWQPIETAPKDEVVTVKNRYFTGEAFYDTKDSDWFYPLFAEDGYLRVIPSPTHFMPRQPTTSQQEARE